MRVYVIWCVLVYIGPFAALEWNAPMQSFLFFYLLLLLLLLILFSSNRHSQCAEPRGSEEESQVAMFTVSRTRLRRLRFYYLIKNEAQYERKKKKLDCSTSQSKAGPNTPVAVVEALETR